jgi:Gram-negative bacterial TonB protein C-terminal
VDPKAGTLITYSEAPGLYFHYDYSKALQFHGKIIPNDFTITQAGQTVVEAQTESVTDPVNNPEAFQTAGLNQIGVGAIMSPAWQYRARLPLPGAAPGAAAQVVELHALQSPTGQVSDIELLASSDAALNEAAIAFASKWHSGMMGQDSQAGATPQSHEVVMTIEYVASQAAPLPPE